MKRQGILLLMATLFVSYSGMAQNGGGLLDPELTMYHFQPLSINPALSGNTNSKWQFGGVWREQAYSISNPFRSAQGYFDLNAPINAWSGNIWGFGLNYVDDFQGDSRMTNRRVNGTVSIGQYLDARQEHSISVGFQGGLGFRGIDYSDTYWDTQWVGQGFNNLAPSGEPELEDVQGYFDLSTGAQYTYYSGDLMELYAGAAVFHVNRPDVGLYNDTNSTNLQRKTNIHAEFVHRIRDNSMFAIRPTLLYSRQANRGYLIGGTRFQFLFSEGTRTTGKRSESSISFGVFTKVASPEYGSKVDMMGTLSMEFAGFTFGAGYDIPLGSFQMINGYEGAYEFMIAYRAGYRRGLYNKYSPSRKGKL
ncbi:MAG: hypothetical protein Salg2KO_12720 [Salibacteraceae bacterium]